MHGADLIAEKKIWDGWNADRGPNYPRDDVVRFCLRRFKDRENRKNVRALDLGCGAGVHSLFLAQEGFNVTVSDISAVGVERAVRRMADHGFSVDQAVASLDELPFPPASFDLVICIGVLDCCPEGVPERAMPGIGKLLKPGGSGQFIFATDKDYRIEDENNPFVRRGFTEAQVKAMFDGAFSSYLIDRITSTENGRTKALDNWMVTVTVK